MPHGQGFVPPANLGSTPASPMAQLGSGLEMQGPDPAIKAKGVQDEIMAIQQLVERVVTQHPAGAAAAQTVASALESMLQEIVATMAPPPGSIAEPPPLP